MSIPGGDVTIEILEQIRDEIRELRVDTNQRLDATNQRLDTINERLHTVGTTLLDLAEQQDRVDKLESK